MNKSVVFFTGFMGSGKSTIGPIVANTLGWDFFDLDYVIEQNNGMKVKDIFAEKSEEYFRQLEFETLKLIIPGGNKIISLGGGTITNQKSMKLIKDNGLLVYLKVTPAEALKRLKFKRDRPVLLQGLGENFTEDELLKNIEEVFEKRKQIYENADAVFNTGSVKIGKTVDELINYINKELR